MTQENTARKEQTEEREAAEQAVHRLSALITRVCHDEPKMDIRLSALADAIGTAIVDYAHNEDGILILDDVIGIRDGLEGPLKNAVMRHMLTRIAKDPETIASARAGRDDLGDLLNTLGVKTHRHSSVTPIPGAVAAAILSAVLHNSRGKDKDTED